MIHPDRLLLSPGQRICFDPQGEPVDDDLPPGSAVMMVSPVTDALKTVDDGVVSGSVGRDQAARVIRLAIDRDLLASIGRRPLRPEDLIDAVRDTGISWAVVRQEDPLRPLSAQ